MGAEQAEVFQGKDGQWYWHRVADNGQVTAEGGEGYTERDSALTAARRENTGLEVVLVIPNMDEDPED